MGEYYPQDKKPDEKKESCNVYVTVYCNSEKKKFDDKFDKKDPCGKPYGYDMDEYDCHKERKVCVDGCNVYVTVFCDCCDKR